MNKRTGFVLVGVFSCILAQLISQVIAQSAPGAGKEKTVASTVRTPNDPTVSPPLRVEASSLKDFHQHALPQQKVGFYGVLLPPDYSTSPARNKRYPVVVILHGSASSEVRHGQLADQFGRKDVIYVVPRAAHPNEPVILKENRIAWSANPTYPESWGERTASTFPNAEIDALDPPSLQLQWIESVLADARKRYRIDDRKALVFGHSQGGQFAHLLALKKPELVRAYFSYAGHFDVTLKTPDDATTANVFKTQGIKPYIAHRENDERVDVKQARDLAGYFARNKVPHSAIILPGGDHMLDSEIHAAVRRFIQEQTSTK